MGPGAPSGPVGPVAPLNTEKAWLNCKNLIFRKANFR